MTKDRELRMAESLDQRHVELAQRLGAKRRRSARAGKERQAPLPTDDDWLSEILAVQEAAPERPPSPSLRVGPVGEDARRVLRAAGRLAQLASAAAANPDDWAAADTRRWLASVASHLEGLLAQRDGDE